MESKKLYFLLTSATTAGVIAGAYGSDVIFSEAQLTGRHQRIEVEDIVRPMPVPIQDSVESLIDNTSCPEIGASCDPATIEYDIVFYRRLGREWYVRRHRQFNYARREATPPAVANWLNSRIEASYCGKVDRRYGNGVCDSDTIDYMIRFIRVDSSTRIIIRLSANVFCTSLPPIDPSPPESPP